jgi:hypothetical protein
MTVYSERSAARGCCRRTFAAEKHLKKLGCLLSSWEETSLVIPPSAQPHGDNA